ncbi:MAG: DUF1972 domain-containing protein [Halobacteriota archaeon]
MKRSIAVIGSRGIPAKYGGFETFVERIAPSLVEDGYEVWASCEGTDPPHLSTYKGVKLFYFPIKPFRRVFYETLYDIFALARASVTCDSLLMLGYGSGFFFFIPKFFRKNIFVNVDGMEWKREKYNKLEKAALYFSERFALFYADKVVADAIAIQNYLAEHGRHAVFIPYGVDEPDRVMWSLSQLDKLSSSDNLANISSREYLLIVARLERENNIYMMIDAFLTARTDKKLMIVGSFLDSDYQKEIETLVARLKGHDRIIFVGAIYDKNVLNMLRQHCFAYLHGHSAGGTNPSLLEAMISRSLICAHDNRFNREVCDDFALFFKDATELSAFIQSLEMCVTENDEQRRENAYNRAKTEYSWDRVLQKYEALISDTELKQ